MEFFRRTFQLLMGGEEGEVALTKLPQAPKNIWFAKGVFRCQLLRHILPSMLDKAC